MVERAWFMVLALATGATLGFGCGRGARVTSEQVEADAGDAGDDGFDPLAGTTEEARQAEFFDGTTVQRLELDIDSADIQVMLDALPERIYVPATFRWQDITLENVGVRFKGNSSSSPNGQTKRSFLIKLNEYTTGQRFLGLRRVALDNAIQFGGLFSERILTDILHEEGVLASRANYATLTINGENKGVYVNVERIDKSFLERHFDDADGTLYKADEGGPGANFAWLGDDPALYEQAFEIKTNRSTADHIALVDFIRDIDQLSDTDFAAWFYDNFNGDTFLRLIAVMALGGAFDQYTGFGAHNFYLYNEPSSGSWTYLPWDLDVGFSDHAFGDFDGSGGIPVIDGWDVSYPLPANYSGPLVLPLLERIVANPGMLDLCRQYASDALETYFAPEIIAARVDTLYAQIEADVAMDPFPPTRVTNPTDTSIDDVMASIKAFAQDRYDAAVEQLANPADAPPVPTSPDDTPPPDGGPAPGPQSPFDPSDLNVVSAAETGIELAWTDNTTDEEVFILQRCTGLDCTEFVNHMPFPADTTAATDPDVTPGVTYGYRVYAMRSGIGFTGASAPATATVPGDPGVEPTPGPISAFDPSGLRVISASATSIELAWIDNSTDEIVFILQRCIGAGCTDFVNTMPLAPDSTGAVDATVEVGLTHRYRVYAIRDGIGASGASEPVTADAVDG